MLNFIVNLVFGKVDESPLYEGMREWDKRNRDKRNAFINSTVNKYREEKEESLAEYKDKKSKGIYFDKQLESYYRAAIMEAIYLRGTDLEGVNAESYRKTAVENILKQMPDGFTVSDPAWGRVVAQLSENSVVKVCLPTLFDGSVEPVWGRIVADRAAEAERRRAAQEARRKKEAEERERRGKLREILQNLESERSRLMSMFSSMQSGSMNRMQVTVAIDALDQRISRIRSEIG